ncbi:glucan 1,4-alpha-glucosidase [Pseudarthrobacter sp. C1]|uniref:glucan 1,4-alpha-glucosidase n=1 Tax=Pseudarthrobacter sp. C1 TaxID=3108940 RepID=UPI002B0537DD|nr:glucan 1,4-alpha-glucosidase [Pseudarthrobacter sp. C1]MEA3552678.1 glucan 1,4-alpha-glucosidase [Pseudarthrobacter sp. C1]
MKHHLRTGCAAVALAVAASTVAFSPASAEAEPAPGAPGASATWTKGDKEGVGSSVSTASKVWYTLTEGTLSEVYYPRADTPNTRELQFAVSDGSRTQRENEDTTRRVELADPQALSYRQITEDSASRWRLTKTYVTDPQRSAVMLGVTFEVLDGGNYQLHALFDPSLAGTSGGDSGRTVGNALVAEDLSIPDTPVASAVVSSSGFSATSTGYVGTSDGGTDLGADGRLDGAYTGAGPGNIAQTGTIALTGAKTEFSLALGFGANAQEALETANASVKQGFPRVSKEYTKEWKQYLQSLDKPAKALDGDLLTQYNVSLMTVKAHEDKTFPGAFIASLTTPWGQVANAEQHREGYHAVWARDMYQSVTALLAAGDEEAARRGVEWLFKYQQLPDGHFPQTSKVDGTVGQNGIQLDETAFPILLASQIGRTDADFYAKELKPAADYLVAAGPKTPQERWEETGGYSTSTLASQIAALAAAGDIAKGNGDAGSAAIYRATADEWQRNTEKWMFTTNGPVGDGNYYLRISGSGDPNDGAVRDWGNGAGIHPENAVLDAGFLEFVRLGVKPPADAHVADSLAETDASISQDTPGGRMWHRYTYDGYGEKADGSPWDGTGIGRLWPLLTGERGEYALANGQDALPYLATMHSAANDGFMIPEQVWDQDEPTTYRHELGRSTGSASPLSWAMAQYVRLAAGMENGSPVETPQNVARRYGSGAVAEPALTVESPAQLSTSDSPSTTVAGITAAAKVYVSVNGNVAEAPLTPTGDGTSKFSLDVSLTGTKNTVTVAAVGADGGTAVEDRTVLHYGTRIGGLQDPSGDDNGPGSYTYPSNPAYVPGAFDLTGVDVYDADDNYAFVTTIAGEVTNPWGGQGISHQRINVYLSNGDTTPTPALPGTNMNVEDAWDSVVVTDGRFDGAGVYAPDGTRTSAVTLLTVPEARQIVTMVPKAGLGNLNPASAKFAVAMFGNAEPGEGIGNVRPVYDGGYWAAGDPSWIKEWRFGGGAGVFDGSTPSRDTDTSDPNALDVVVREGQSQAAVLDWQAASPVVVPMVGLKP